METIYLAGGCFWCMEEAFLKITGIKKSVVGYIGKTEVIQLVIDPALITFLQVLDFFWLHIDPFDLDGQFYDRGEQYHTIIYYTGSQQERLAIASKTAVEKLLGRKVAVKIEPAGEFKVAEEHHQSYCLKEPAHFKTYQLGHLAPLGAIWKPIEKQVYQTLLEDKLTTLQWHVTQQAGTEPPFRNVYWDEKREGLYLDIVTKDPLFSSEDKFDSGTGWPSFTNSLISLIERADQEVLSPYSGAHLGHVFPDGPPNRGGLRYCINSAALFFLPKNLSD